MSDKKLGQEPAFPGDLTELGQFGDFNRHDEGMSKRFFAACAAMQGILASWTRHSMPEKIGIEMTVKTAYECADELLKQEFKNEKD